MSLLDVENLSLSYRLSHGWAHAVDDVSFSIAPGETLGLVGESGCGKSSVAFSLMRVLPPGARLTGQVNIDGTNLLELDDAAIRDVRWKRIAIVFQAAMNALNPVFRINDQVAEALLRHEPISRKAAKDRVAEMFELVGIARSRANAYPHELSGGMKQRVIIAMSLICRPQLLIADEPTTALDVVMQDQILGTIKDLQEQFHFALLIISHDIAMIAQTCDRTAVMYGGKLMEVAPTGSLFAETNHPYTHALLQAYPSIDGPHETLIGIPGQPPDLVHPPAGCRFAPRCTHRQSLCVSTDPDLHILNPDHLSRCHFARQFATEVAVP